ncbi:hypothetical protein OQA88_9701 [Cercophora sp. LCS_1]
MSDMQMDVDDHRLGAAVQATVLAENADLKLSVLEERVGEETLSSLFQKYLSMLLSSPVPANPTLATSTVKRVTFAPSIEQAKVVPQTELYHDRSGKSHKQPSRHAKHHDMPEDIEFREYLITDASPTICIALPWPENLASPMRWHGALEGLSYHMILILAQTLPDLWSETCTAAQTTTASAAVNIGFRIYLLLQEVLELKQTLHIFTQSKIPRVSNESTKLHLALIKKKTAIRPSAEDAHATDGEIKDCIARLAALSDEIENDLHLARDHVEYLVALADLIEQGLDNECIPKKFQKVVAEVLGEMANGLNTMEENLEDDDDFFCGASPAFVYGDEDWGTPEEAEKLMVVVKLRAQSAESRVRRSYGAWLRLATKLKTAWRLQMVEEKRRAWSGLVDSE